MTRRAADLRNPFGIRPPCDDLDLGEPVPGYGDPDADVHVIGSHAGEFGGSQSGIPFSDSAAGRSVREVLAAVELLEDPTGEEPLVRNTYLSYLWMCSVRPAGRPRPTALGELERFFDAELRAVNAHVLIPVGTVATNRILAEYTTLSHKIPATMDWRHARDIRGRGFLVVPMKHPSAWRPGDRSRFIERLRTLLASDYRQTKGVATLIG